MVNRKHMRNITYIFTGCLFVLFGMGLISCNESVIGFAVDAVRLLP